METALDPIYLAEWIVAIKDLKQYLLGKGLKEFGIEGDDTVMTHPINMKDMFVPTNPDILTKQHKRVLLESLVFIEKNGQKGKRGDLCHQKKKLHHSK